MATEHPTEHPTNHPAGHPTHTYEPTWESVGRHPLPQWYDDAKLGIFLHWGLYSVPGWAPQVPDIQQMIREQGPESVLRNNPYAEWYRNSMQIEGSPTWHHHREAWGADFAYDDFAAEFDEGTGDCDIAAIAGICRDAGAGYVVLTTKHHEGFTLWPSEVPHPHKGSFHARRDLVGDMAEAVRAEGMRLGLYYSGGYDWSYNGAVLREPADAMLAVPHTPDYERYATAHVTELIDRYRPSVLWNDVCWPAGGNLAALFAHYYNTVPDGVVNDRWLEPTTPRDRFHDALARGAGRVIQALWSHIPDTTKSLTFPGANWFDFNTPEYASFDDVQEKKWESTRGVGHSFGANRNEAPGDIVSSTELVRSFCDIVAKNGNLLIGIGPDGTGRIRDQQIHPLRGLGEWMAANGEAVRGTRPWDLVGTVAADGTEVRFTRGADAVYALLLGEPGERDVELRGIDPATVTRAELVDGDVPLACGERDGALTLELPERLPVTPVVAIRLPATARPSPGA